VTKASATGLANWSSNYTYRAPRIHRPDTIGQVQDIVAGSDRAKALGSRHCFNDIADTAGDLIDLTGLPVDLDVTGDGTATVTAGTSYGRLATALREHSLALPNLASLPHISVAGAVATGTHGSGVANRALGASLSGIELIRGDGELIALRRGRDADFAGAVVGLGALGIVTRVSLDVEPAYQVRQDVFEDLPWGELEAHFDEIVSSAYSVSLFSNLQGPAVSQVWCKSRLTPAGDSTVFDPGGLVRPSFFGAKPATVTRHPLPGLSGDVCTAQLGVPGPWFERLPHFQLAFTPSNGEELQTEYLVPRDLALDVLAILRGLAPRIAPLLQVSEIRTVAADELWLSPAYQRDCVAFHFTWVRDQPAVERLLAEIEDAIAECRPRPHWGKLFAADRAALAAAYDRLPDFRRLAERVDPAGVFRNDYLDRYVFGG
jgi:xylitol oxidase